MMQYTMDKSALGTLILFWRKPTVNQNECVGIVHVSWFTCSFLDARMITQNFSDDYENYSQA